MSQRRKVVSRRKLAANRANAQLSTGPRTAAGKAASRMNALRHGLARPIVLDEALAAEYDELADLFAGDASEPTVRSAALRVVEAQLELVRIREVWIAALDMALAAEPLEIHPKRRRIIVKLGRALVKAHEDGGAEYARLRREVDEFGDSQDQSFEMALAFRMLLLVKPLGALKRYEQRALSRRSKAVRDLMAARHFARQPRADA